MTTKTSSTRKCGCVFTRWGHTKRPTINDTEVLYKGKAAGSQFNQSGGEAKSISLPDEPKSLSYTPGISEGKPYIYGAEYQIHTGPLSPLHDHSVHCVVCYVSTYITYSQGLHVPKNGLLNINITP